MKRDNCVGATLYEETQQVHGLLIGFGGLLLGKLASYSLSAQDLAGYS